MSFLDRFDLFVFDLDGTLADTREDLAASLNHALDFLGRPPLDLETVTSYVGNGARTLIERALGSDANPERIEAGLDSFVQDYREGCLRKTTLYPGTAATLEGLRSKHLAVLTNKPLYHSRKILAALGLEHYFLSIVGGDTLPSKKPDPAGLHTILQASGVAPERTLLIGDSAVDIETARAAGVTSAFVTYGFSPDAEREARPDHVLSSLRELLDERPS
jgi:phosphoglycolate phosphatase